jgi:hypothetical protein
VLFRVLVQIAVSADLMPSVGDHAQLVGECPDQMVGNEPTGLLIVLLKELQQTRRPPLPRTHDGARLSPNSCLVALHVARIPIGQEEQIGPNVQLLTAMHPSSRDPLCQMETAQPILLRKDVWLGGGVVAAQREPLATTMPSVVRMLRLLLARSVHSAELAVRKSLRHRRR